MYMQREIKTGGWLMQQDSIVESSNRTFLLYYHATLSNQYEERKVQSSVFHMILTPVNLS